MKEQPLRVDDSSYKLVIDILANLIKEYHVSYDPSSDQQESSISK